MSALHFFKLNSRLGLLNIPHRQRVPNIGVEEAPSAILSADFVDSFPQPASVDEFTFATPDNLTFNSQVTVIAKYMDGAADLLNRKLKEKEIQIAIGGDHSISFATLLARIRRYGASQIGYVQIDSHGDSNTFSSSPTANFHGMFLRPFYADFDSEEITRLIPEKLRSDQIMFIGNLDLDPEEKELFKNERIRVIEGSTLAVIPTQAFVQISQFMSRHKYLHVSLDIDAFDKSLAPGTGIPAEKGLLKKEIFPILKLLGTHPNFSFDLVEVNPKKEGGDMTVQFARSIIRHVFLS